MKRLILLLLMLAVMVSVSAYTSTETGAPEWTREQHQLHEIANMARALGLPEDSPIITEASRLWYQEETDLRILANVIRNEAPYCTDRHQQLVAQVILNRVASPMFPDTVEDVVNQPKQYDPAYTRDLPTRAGEDAETERAFRNALKAMNGEVECPANVLYQSEYDFLGSGSYEIIFVDTEWFYSTTYFNYG